MDPEITKGKFLIALPTLQDQNFRQAIILLCEHGPDGSLGLVVNRPTNVEVSTLIEDLPELDAAGQVYAGGPVGKNGMLILCRGDATFEDRAILEDVFLAHDIDVLKIPWLRGRAGEIRCYVGYAGWAAGQLEAEVNAGAWRVLEGDSKLIFDANLAILWQEMMLQIGGECAIYASMPPDLSLN
ncbi:MAG: YqgE/AlgH family protein [Nitrospiria bacterium]